MKEEKSSENFLQAWFHKILFLRFPILIYYWFDDLIALTSNVSLYFPLSAADEGATIYQSIFIYLFYITIVVGKYN